MLFAAEEAGEEGGAAGFGAGGGRGGVHLTEAAVDFGPGGEGAEVAVVDVDVGGDFAAALIGCRGRRELFGEVGVDGVKRESALLTPFEGILQ